jgi:FdrA protein
MEVDLLKRLEVVKGEYYDSVTLMLVAKELKKIEGVSEATLNMATEANLHIMKAAGFEVDGVNALPDDLIIGIDCPGDLFDGLMEMARSYLSSPPWKSGEEAGEYTPRTIEGALSVLPEADIALISLPGRYAAVEAMKALERGLNVMLYSDNVSLEEEIELKRYAFRNGLIVMGPDCGTVVINGQGLGFSNACPLGPVGIVSASGTGLQEVMVQLARRGAGVKHGLGTGGRDVKSAVGGISSLTAVETLASDPEISVVVFIGKPPSPEVREKIVHALRSCGKQSVTCFMGESPRKDELQLKYTTALEECATVVAALLDGKDAGKAREDLMNEYLKIETLGRKSEVSGRFLRGLFTGGTLCYEAESIARRYLESIYGNNPLKIGMKLPDSLKPIQNSFIDYGEDEFTQGRLHPMIDPSFRTGQLKIQSEDPSVAVILFDVVLGYGSAPDPSSEVAGAIKSLERKKGPLYVAYVCGTSGDPQGLERQIHVLKEAGVHVFESNARAAVFAAAATDGRERK